MHFSDSSRTYNSFIIEKLTCNFVVSSIVLFSYTDEDVSESSDLLDALRIESVSVLLAPLEDVEEDELTDEICRS